jgi:hypothetical protein
MSITYRNFVSVHINDDNSDGPTTAVINLNKKQIKRIHQLAKAVKDLKVTYIEEWDPPEALMNEEVVITDTVTDKTPLKECALHINDDNPVTAIYAKRRLAGDSVNSTETFEEIKRTLTEWNGSSECDMIKVSRDDFHYQGIFRHTDVSWETESIPLKDLPKIK